MSQEAPPTMANAVGSCMEKHTIEETCFGFAIKHNLKIEENGIHYWMLNNYQRIMDNKSYTMEQVVK